MNFIASDGDGYIVSSIVTGLFGIFLVYLNNRTNKKVNSIKDQVVNGHKKADGTPINLRDEQDERHLENTKAIHALDNKLNGLIITVRNILTTVTTDSNRIHDLEETSNANEIARIRKEYKENND